MVEKMTKYKNNTGKLVSFSFPEGMSMRWITVEPNNVAEIPDSETWRAEAFNLTKVSGTEKPKEIPKQPEFVKKKGKMIPELLKIKGLGLKVVEEISEEYDTIQEVVRDIKNKKFRVGGIDKVKQNLILRGVY